MDELFIQLRTKEEAKRAISEIELLLKSFSKPTPSSLEEGIKKIVSERLADFFIKSLKPLSGTRKQTEYLEDLLQKISSLPALSLTIAFEPTEESIDVFSSWAKSNIDSNVLLDIHFDTVLVGGAIVEYEGMYRDYSLKKKIEEMFAQKREEVVKPLQS